MARKRLTQIFPWLLPLRVWQRRCCFYLKMRLDKNRYADRRTDAALPFRLFETSCPMRNRATGLPMLYQENKVFNLKLAAAPLNGLLIGPGETFSFWHAVRRAEKAARYKDGLATVNGRLVPRRGGGLCQLSNLLFWMFLHTPLTIVERHGHSVKDFPEPPSDAPAGVDATVSEGWLDLRVRNDTAIAFQLVVSFDEERITGRVLAGRDEGLSYQAIGDGPRYIRGEDGVYEETDIVRHVIDNGTGQRVSGKRLYRNRCKINYPLPDERIPFEKGTVKMEKKNVLVLFGGCSPEYGVSLQSACGVLRHMDTTAYTPVMVGITPEGGWFHFAGEIDSIAADTWYTPATCTPCVLSPNRGARALLLLHETAVDTMAVDAVFPVLHGQNGEDGTVQGLCELAGIPLAGCGTLASALCMDKDRAHTIARSAGVRVPRSFVIEKGFDLSRVLEQAEDLGYPLFIKPVKAGSSFGIAKVTDSGGLPAAVERAFGFDSRVMAEEAVDGFEVGCAVMGNSRTTTGEIDEIELADGFFDYTEKYTLHTSQIHVPARLSSEKAQELKETAQTLYRALGCRGFARVDMFLTAGGGIVFNEVNTIPGFTAHSRFPRMMEAAGYTFGQIVSRAVELALYGDYDAPREVLP